MKAQYEPHVDNERSVQKGIYCGQIQPQQGSTADLTLVGNTAGEKQESWIWEPRFDFFSPQSWPTYFPISASARAHRMLLQRVMEEN